MKYSEILSYFKDAIKAFGGSKYTFGEGSIIRAIGEVVSSLVAKVFAAIDAADTRLYVTTARGEDLDRILSNFSIVRKTPSPSSGFVRLWFTSLDPNSTGAATIIPSGTIVFSEDGGQYITTEVSVIPKSLAHYPSTLQSNMGSVYYAVPLDSTILSYSDDEFSMTLQEIQGQFTETIDVKVQSVEVGAATNIAAQQINKTGISNLSCSNPYPVTSGTDLEADETFRRRGLDFIRGANSKFSKASLSSFIGNIDGIMDCNVVEDYNCLTFSAPRAGHVYAIINTSLVPVTRDTSVPYPVKFPRNIYEIVRNKIEDESYRPLGIGVTVREADIYNVDFRSSDGDFITVYIKDGVSASNKRIDIQDRLYRYFLDLSIGTDVFKTSVIKLLMEDTDIVDIGEFSFFRILGVDSEGNDVGDEFDSLTASCNQVFRVSSPESLSIKVIRSN